MQHFPSNLHLSAVKAAPRATLVPHRWPPCVLASTAVTPEKAFRQAQVRTGGTGSSECQWGASRALPISAKRTVPEAQDCVAFNQLVQQEPEAPRWQGYSLEETC